MFCLLNVGIYIALSMLESKGETLEETHRKIPAGTPRKIHELAEYLKELFGRVREGTPKGIPQGAPV